MAEGVSTDAGRVGAPAGERPGMAGEGTAVPFDYGHAGLPVPEALAAAHRAFWERLAGPGTWWTGAERVAIAEAAREAGACDLCRRRREALSPAAVGGGHEARPPLPAAAVDAVHRLITDPGRITRAAVEEFAREGISDARYVELLGLVVAVFSVDEFHRALGLPLEPLPVPRPGEPSRQRPAEAAPGVGFVPMLPSRGRSREFRELYGDIPGGFVPHVLRALSLVPEAVRDLGLLAAVHYLPPALVARPGAMPEGRVLDRKQVELLAGRVSALNECFY